ncbi:N-acetyltransferase [Vibrio mangrovi]|uniref:Acetyltransferase (GNAT) family protein n=1 Tax=Vibrio mangrovi TaxID=474394 RepID=A0A1Y6INH8_9VIBR|nr:N-acetyltransferase [Vibrio mangrovi]MDW6003989.1 N-acetyltransferase [Vibrio mangrovi]SMR99214.1 Acetyltransferase (GNAT) family protein [Vibrio mangrovi]
MSYITLTEENIDSEHICCAFSDKKCTQGYQLKKAWLKQEFSNGYTFLRLDERAKVFIEYGPAEHGWVPVNAPNYLLINCFWVSGKYKGQGHGKALLQQALDDAQAHKKDGIVTVAGVKKYHFMSDTKWLLNQGFEICATTTDGFCLLVRKLNNDAMTPFFNPSAIETGCPETNGIVVYYSNRCPFAEYHVQESLTETARKRNLPLKVVRLETQEQAQSAPTPATIFSLYYNGQFVTTDISICMDSRFDTLLKKHHQ